jgi:hypothetical protein
MKNSLRKSTKHLIICMGDYDEILKFQEKLIKNISHIPKKFLTVEQKQQSTNIKYCNCLFRQYERPIDNEGNCECFNCGLEIKR